MRAVIYCRVSLDKMVERGVSLEAQIEKCKAIATVRGDNIVDTIVDGGESAKSLDRPGIQRVLAWVREGKADSIIVAKLDRLTRSVRDLADLLELFNRRGVSLVSVAESLDTRTAAGRFGLNMLISASQWEREQLGERTRDALQFKKSKGERVGNIEYGFRLGSDGTHIEPTADEQAVMKRILRLRKGGLSLRKIADDLNQKGLKTRSGGEWHHVYVGSIVKRHRNVKAAA